MTILPRTMRTVLLASVAVILLLTLAGVGPARASDTLPCLGGTWGSWSPAREQRGGALPGGEPLCLPRASPSGVRRACFWPGKAQTCTRHEDKGKLLPALLRGPSVCGVCVHS